MKLFTKKKKQSVNKEIARVLTEMSKLEPNSKEYTMMANNLELLMSAISKKKAAISFDTVMTVVGSLGGIALIVFSEETRVITSKALSFVVKGRV